MSDGPLTCKNCGEGVYRLYFNSAETLGWCGNCITRSKDSHVYTGKKLWLGSEVYGKKLNSDELRADTEDAMLGGSGRGLKG